jgi:hypothetical protein
MQSHVVDKNLMDKNHHFSRHTNNASQKNHKELNVKNDFKSDIIHDIFTNLNEDDH